METITSHPTLSNKEVELTYKGEQNKPQKEHYAEDSENIWSKTDYLINSITK